MADQLERDRIYTSADVARLLFRHPVEWFYRYRATIGVAEGFPMPISAHGQPRWSGEALIAWRDRPGRQMPSLLPQEGSSSVVDIRDRLRTRSHAMAGKGAGRLPR